MGINVIFGAILYLVWSVGFAKGEFNDCGLPSNPRIWGGDALKDGNFPWLVRLAGIWSCSGTLVSNRHVITARHCFLYDNGTLSGRLGKNGFIIGMMDFTEYNIKDYYLVKSIAALNDFDICVAELIRPVTFSNTIRPICLPNVEDLIGKKYLMESFLLAGYGGTKPEHNWKIARIMNVTVAWPKYCGPRSIELQYFCTEVDFMFHGSHTDSGDSGGPVAFYYRLDKRYYLMGVHTGRINDVYHTSVRVDYVIDWVMEMIKFPKQK